MNSAKPGSTSKSAATKERILLRAAELFRAQGYDAVSLRGIAKHADMQAASLYYYFETKEDILLSVIGRGLTELHIAVDAALQQLPATSSTRDRLECAIYTHLDCLANGGVYPATFTSVYLQLPHKLRYQKSPVRDKYFDLWLKLLKSGVANGELRADLNLLLARRFILVSLTRSVEWEEFKEQSTTDLTAFFVQLFLDGIS